MKILLIHNRYQQAGGEDAVFENERKLLEGGGHLVKTLEFDNTNISLNVRAALGLFFNVDSKRQVEQVIREFSPDVIHVHNFFYLASPSIFYATHASRVPVVVTLHNYRLICSGALLMRDNRPCERCVQHAFPLSGIRYACHRGSRIQTAQLTMTTGIHKILGTWNRKVTCYIALTDFAKQKFLHSSLNLKPEQIVVKPNSVDDISHAGSHGRNKHFLFIGRLSKEKGVEVLLNAFRSKEEKLEIIGDGPLRSKVLEAASVSSNIMYHGYRDRMFVADKLRTCRAIIVPSVCYESLPTAILEAFSAGTPVIVSDIGNLNEIVRDGYNGTHFKTNDPADLYRKTQAFTAADSQYENFSLHARKTFEERYSHEINYRQLMDIYRRAVEKNETTTR